MEGTLEKNKRFVTIHIADGKDVIYNEHIDSIKDFDNRLSSLKNMNWILYGRTWIFDIRSDLAFRKQVNNNQPLVILIGGIVIDTLLLILFIVFTAANRKALDFINRIIET